MNNVTPLFKPKVPEPDPHLCGTAFCIGCKHTWTATAPLGTVDLECPNCGTHKGKFKFECQPEEGTEVRECKCGNHLFYLTREGHLCANCGIFQIY